jgi:uncharacterized protein (TIGR02246 family)
VLSSEDRNGVDKLREKLVAAILTADTATYVDCYEEDGILMHPGSPPIQGHTALREHVSAMFSAIRVTKLVLSPIVVDGSPDLAYDAGTQDLGIEPAIQGFGSRRKYLHVMRKQPNGTWKLVVGTSSDNG